MTVFRSSVAEVVTAVQAGKHVRIRGKRVSGKTSVLRDAGDLLERSGINIVSGTGEALAAGAPGYLLSQIQNSLGITQQINTPAAAVDAIAAALSERDVVAIDNLHLGDSLSLRVLAAARDRAGFRMMYTETTGRSRHGDFPMRWPEHAVAIPDLDLGLCTFVVKEILGGEVAADTLAQLYSESGGVLGLTRIVTESARDTGALSCEDGLWSLRTPQVWNPHLATAVEALHAEYEPEMQRFVRWLARKGGAAETDVRTHWSEDTVEQALELSAVLASTSGNTREFRVWPPVCGYRYQDVTSTQLAVAAVGDPHPADVLLAQMPRGDELAQLAARFREADRDHTLQRFSVWAQVPNITHALRYLEVGFGLHSEEARVQQVFARTTPELSVRYSYLTVQFSLRKIQWLLWNERDSGAVDEILTQLVMMNPDRERSLRSSVAVMRALCGESLPQALRCGSEYESASRSGTVAGAREAANESGEAAESSANNADSGSREYESELFLSSSVVAALIGGDLPAIGQLLVKMRPREDMRGVVAYAEPAYALLRGNVRRAIELALSGRADAESAHDRSAYCVLTYLAVLGAQHIGDHRLARQLLAESVVVGQPRAAYRPVQAALLRIGAGFAHFDGYTSLRDHLLHEARLLSSDEAPYLGMDDSFSAAVFQAGVAPEAFTETIVTLVESRESHGFFVGALQTAVAGLTLHWSRALAASFLRVYAALPVPLMLYREVADTVTLILHGDGDGLRAQLGQLERGDEACDVLLRLCGAALRAERAGSVANTVSADTAENAETADGAGHTEPLRAEFVVALSDACELLRALLGGNVELRNERPTGEASMRARPEVTPREYEIGLLAAELSNAQIAERLHLSRRTVEHHIANALRKTGAADRTALAALLVQAL